MTLTYYRITVLKHGRVHDRQLERSDEVLINTYIARMRDNGYGLDIEAIDVPAGLKSREAQVLWAVYCDDRGFGKAVDAAYDRKHISQRERVILLRAGIERRAERRGLTIRRKP